MNKVRIETNEGEASIVSLNGRALEHVVSVSQSFEIDGFMYATLVFQSEPIELVRSPDEAATKMQQELDNTAVLAAYNEGKIIEWRHKGSDEWFGARVGLWPHAFDFDSYDYRFVQPK